jgi:hypothetical protein
MAPAEGNQQKADATATASSSTAVAEETKKQLPQLGALEEDDEFEEVRTGVKSSGQVNVLIVTSS